LGRGIGTVTGMKPVASSMTPEFEHLLFASEPMGSFKRSFNLSPQLYNITGLTSSLSDGVMTIVVPKKPQPATPQAVTLFGGTEGQLTHASSKEMRALRNARSILTVKKLEDANMLTYECDVAPFISQNHIEINLLGRMLNIAVRYTHHVKTANHESSENAMYSTGVAVPEGTTPNDVHTTFAPGKLTIKLDKHATTPPAITVKNTPPTNAPAPAVTMQQ